MTVTSLASPPEPAAAATGLPSIARVLERERDAILERWYHNQFVEALQRFPNPYAEEADPLEVRSSHLRPLLDLLAEYARSGDALFLALYRDERRRYAPHRQGAGTLREFFTLLLPADEAAVLETLPASQRSAAAEWLAQVHAPLVSASAGTPVRVLTIGDCLLSEIQAFLHPLGAEEGLDLDFRYYYFSAVQGADIVQDGIAKAIEGGKIDVIAASYLSYSGLPLYRSLLESADRITAEERRQLVTGMLRFMEDHLRQIRKLTDVPILLHNASGLPLGRWRRRIPVLPAMSRGRQRALEELNAAIAALAAGIENCILVDERAVARQHGLRASDRQVLPRRIGAGAQIHPAWFGRHLAGVYTRILGRIATLRKTKLLLVDFDNTLWHGVMADGPVRHEVDRQRLLKRLREQGIVLAAVSKNDPRNIRWEEMALAPEDFAALKINWNPKPQSIKELAEELNLGLDAFVLIDDNPAERELVRLETPAVRLLDATDPASWDALELLFQMPNTRQTEEARRRTEMYREQAERAAVVRSETDYPALMAKLQLRARIRPAVPADLERLTELVQRTNQFNTTTIRYSRAELERLIASGEHLVLVGQLADKFGDLGVVAVAVVERQGDAGTIASFVMSCRAMGFGMEYSMLAQAVAHAGVREVLGRFIPSARNEPASALFPGAGFVERAPGEWVLPPERQVEAPAWIAVHP